MGPTFVLLGMLLIMMSVIWIVGEVLKTNVVLGVIALVTFPIFSVYWTFFEDFQKCKTPFLIGTSGLVFAIIGRVIGW